MLGKIREYFSRKFVLASMALIGTFHLALVDKELGGWAAALAVILGFYNGSNVYQEYLASKNKGGDQVSESNDKE